MKFIIEMKKGTLKSKLKRNFKIGYLKELQNRNSKGTFKSKFKSHFKIEILKGTLKSKVKRNFKIEI